MDLTKYKMRDNGNSFYFDQTVITVTDKSRTIVIHTLGELPIDGELHNTIDMYIILKQLMAHIETELQCPLCKGSGQSPDENVCRRCSALGIVD